MTRSFSVSSTLQLRCFQTFLGCITLYLLDIIKGIEQPLAFQPLFSHSSCLLKKSYNMVKVVKLHHWGTAISSCEARPRPRRHWALSYKNMRVECLIHKAFEGFLKCIAMGDSGLENCLLRILFFISFSFSAYSKNNHNNFMVILIWKFSG